MQTSSMSERMLLFIPFSDVDQVIHMAEINL